jgi:hypothetical protein
MQVEVVLGILIVGLLVFFSYKFYIGPVLPKLPTTSEGFGGAPMETGVPDCLRTSSEAAKIAGIFQNAGYDNDNYRELIELLGKLACFKKDLLSPSNIIEATRRQPFSTSHDMEPLAETTGRCYTKTISPRDLELSFDKWNSRGKVLINRLSSICRIKSAEQEEAKKLFEVLIRDVKDIARGSCLQGVPVIGGKPGPRDAHPYEDPSLQELGEYKGYY